MLKSLLSVSGFTLLSRLTGFAREIVMAYVIGAGAIMDAFAVALRLPNHFRAIFAEGAFSAAFVPTYTRLRTAEGPERADSFQGRMLTLLTIAAGGIVVLALLYTPQVIDLLAPGFSKTPARYALAIELTRITFPYLLMITLITLWSGVLNASGRFAVAAAAPIVLNLALIAAMGFTVYFPSAGHAAAWSVFAAGVVELAILAIAANRAGILALPRWPRLTGRARDTDLGTFFTRFGPAVIGSAGTQIAMFADTILASLLPLGAPSSLYYAERIYQLPIGVIAVAAGTVLLPEMSRRIAAGDVKGAHGAQNRVIGFSTIMTLPCVVAFFLIPDLIMRALLARGAFSAQDAAASGAVLLAYGAGLPAVVLIRAVVASFQARGDTTTPMVVALLAVAVNVALKVALTQPYGASGLAFATSAGAWINLVLLGVVALRRGFMTPDRALLKTLLAALLAGVAMAAAMQGANVPLASLALNIPHVRDLAHLALLGGAGLVFYSVGLAVLAKLFKVRLLRR